MEYPILPSHIRTDQPFFGFFEGGNLDRAALRIVKHCQQLGGWRSISYATLVELGIEPHAIGELTGGPVPYLQPDHGNFTPTHRLIAKCFEHSPAVSDPYPPGQRISAGGG